MTLESSHNSDDLEIEQIESEERDNEITPLNYDLSIYPADFTLEVLYQKWKNDDIKIPKFQRGFVWNIVQSSRLIESIMMGLPIPPIFLYVQDDNTNLVIDGRQRLETIFYFFEGFFKEEDDSGKRRVFKLVGINPDNPLFKKSFEDFDESEKRKFKNYVLRAIMIKQLDPKNDATSIYHIFERLNTGGISLQDQEVRNCVYEGSLNNLLLEINQYPGWRKIMGKIKLDTRQKDVAFILRYMSLFHNSENYKKPMKDFLSKFMNDNKNPSKEFLQHEEDRFKKTCDTLVSTLGEKPFHPKRNMSPSMFDSIFVAFAKHVDKLPDNIKERFQKLVSNEEFKKSISDATTDTDVVNNRLKLAESILFG